MSEYEIMRRENVSNNEAMLHSLGLGKVKIGATVHIPASVFPEEEAPSKGYWVGKTVRTIRGGIHDIGVRAEGDDGCFTRSKLEVAGWLI